MMPIVKASRIAMIAFAAAVAVLASPAALAREGKPGGRDRESSAVRLSGREVSIIPQLTEALGNFDKEGIKVEVVHDTVYEGPHYRMQRALNRGEIDMSVHWFQHVLYGHAHKEPTVGLMMFNGSPGLTIMVPNRLKSRVRSAADFKGLKIAEGMGYSTKSIVVNLLAARAGLPARSYTPILGSPEGRLPATLKALDSGDVDIIAFREPHTTEVLKTGRASVIYDLTTPERTARVLGAAYPAQSLFTSPAYLRKHPAKVQKVVNALVRTMRFVNTHNADEIAAAMPDYFKGKDKQAEVALIRAQMPTYAVRNFRISVAQAKLMQQAIDNAQYDDSDEGRFRAVARKRPLVVNQVLDNSYVDRAMRRIR